MPVFAGQPQARILHNPAGSELLQSFSCGTGVHEVEVNNLVQRQFDGTRQFPATVLVLTNALGRTIGVCGYRSRPVTFAVLEVPASHSIKVPLAEVSVPDAAYIHMIGVCQAFRGWRLEDGTRLGTALLRATVRQLAKECGRTPIVWAYVAEDNRASHRMFASVEFGLIERRHRGAETIRFRAAERPVV